MKMLKIEKNATKPKADTFNPPFIEDVSSCKFSVSMVTPRSVIQIHKFPNVNFNLPINLNNYKVIKNNTQARTSYQKLVTQNTQKTKIYIFI